MPGREIFDGAVSLNPHQLSPSAKAKESTPKKTGETFIYSKVEHLIVFQHVMYELSQSVAFSGACVEEGRRTPLDCTNRGKLNFCLRSNFLQRLFTRLQLVEHVKKKIIRHFCRHSTHIAGGSDLSGRTFRSIKALPCS